MTTNLHVKLKQSPVAVRLAALTGKMPRAGKAGSAAEEQKQPVVEKPASMPDQNASIGQQLLAVCEQISLGMEQLHGQQKDQLEQLQSTAIELAIAATEAVLNASIGERRVSLEGIVSQLVGELGSESPVAVYLNPVDAVALQMATTRPDVSKTLANVKVIAAADVPAGTCRVTNAASTLKTDLQSRLNAIRDQWMESLNVARAGHRSADAVS